MNRTPPGEAVEKDTSTAGSHRGPAARPAPRGPARPPPPGPAPSPPARRRPRCPAAPSRRRAQPIRAAAAFSQPMGEARGWRPRPPPRQAPPTPCEAAGRWRMAEGGSEHLDGFGLLCAVDSAPYPRFWHVCGCAMRLWWRVPPTREVLSGKDNLTGFPKEDVETNPELAGSPQTQIIHRRAPCEHFFNTGRLGAVAASLGSLVVKNASPASNLLQP